MKLTIEELKMKINMINKQKKIIIGIFLTLMLIIMPSMFIQAKFMRKANAKSVSMASGFYFSSNKLSEVEHRGATPEIPADANEVPAEYVIEGWDGNAPVTFDFDIRDYQNPLLYKLEAAFADRVKSTYKGLY